MHQVLWERHDHTQTHTLHTPLERLLYRNLNLQARPPCCTLFALHGMHSEHFKLVNKGPAGKTSAAYTRQYPRCHAVQCCHSSITMPNRAATASSQRHTSNHTRLLTAAISHHQIAKDLLAQSKPTQDGCNPMQVMHSLRHLYLIVTRQHQSVLLAEPQLLSSPLYPSPP